MKKLIILPLLFGLLYAAEINQKMILSSSLNTEEMKQVLKEANNFFLETPEVKEMQEKYALKLQLEHLDQYTMLTLKPIDSYRLKNKLLYLLQQAYPDLFMVEDTHIASIYKEKTKVKTIRPSIDKSVQQPTSVPDREKKVQARGFLETLSLEWIALILLAIAGLLLVYRSAKQISKIKNLQKEVETYQHRVQKEISAMEGSNE